METKAVARYLLISPRKVRLVANELRGFSYPEAVDSLRFMPQKAAHLLLKLLRSGRASIGNISEDVEDHNLYIKKLYVDEGPVLKRFRPQSRGRAASRLKRTSNITVVLSNE